MQNALFSDKKFKLEPATTTLPNSSNLSASINSTEEIVVLDKDKINECFRVILKATNETIRKEADNFLIHCEKNSMFYSFLLEIFESTQVFFFIFFKVLFIFVC